jgi:4-hydroxybenzoate polyprenyltransferase
MPAWVRLLRPLQWTKNVVVLAGVVFSGNATDPDLLVRAIIAFAAFCLVSSAMYVFNDWHDRAEDRLHPTKRFRPIASGEVPADRAIGLAIALLGIGLVVAALISIALAAVVLAYALLIICYTLWLRQVPFVDLCVIAIGFVLRALAGTVAVNVSISSWLFICTLLLALLLGMGKRTGEIFQVKETRKPHRSTLDRYRRLNVTRLLLVTGLSTVAAYLMYTLAVPAYGRSVPMVVTAPFVAAGVGRYLWLVIREHRGSAPERLLFEDAPLLAAIVAWGLAVATVLAS